MEAVQTESKKIQKKPKADPNGPKDFLCGGCPNGYRSYPALYLHVQRKHNGKMPAGTQILRRKRPQLHVEVQPGRPNKATKNIDEIPPSESCLEAIQNDLINFLGDKLLITSEFARKTAVEAIEQKIKEIYQGREDKWSKDLLGDAKLFLTEYKARDQKMQHLDFDEEFKELDPENGLRVIVWFMVWLLKLYVKLDFASDLCFIFSKIWKVLDETQLNAQDLDNKLVWRKAIKECEGSELSPLVFKKDTTLLNEFIQKVCQLIGKVFEKSDR